MKWLSVQLSTGMGRQEVIRKEGFSLCSLLYGARGLRWWEEEGREKEEEVLVEE